MYCLLQLYDQRAKLLTTEIRLPYHNILFPFVPLAIKMRPLCCTFTLKLFAIHPWKTFLHGQKWIRWHWCQKQHIFNLWGKGNLFRSDNSVKHATVLQINNWSSNHSSTEVQVNMTPRICMPHFVANKRYTISLDTGIVIDHYTSLTRLMYTTTDTYTLLIRMNFKIKQLFIFC